MKLKNLLLPGAIIVLFAVLYHLLSDYTLASPKLPEVKSMKKPGAKCKPANTFSVGNKIWARGLHLFRNTQVKIYIVAQDDRCSWKFGDSIGTDVSGTVETVTTTARGKFLCEEIWGSASAGNYDIVVDVNQNEIYDSGDAVDSIAVGTGFTVGTQPVVTPGGSADTYPIPPDLPDYFCDSTQFSFLQTQDVYADGEGFPPGATVDIYVKTNQGWNFGDSIGTDNGDGVNSGVTITTDTDPDPDVDVGGRLPCTKIWNNPLTVGEYDIVVDVNTGDVNKDGFYDAGDAIYNRCLETAEDPSLQQTGAGFIVEADVLPLNGSCGDVQTVFHQIDSIYVVSEGLPASTGVDIYVKNNATWTLGNSIGTDDGDGSAANVTTNANGELPCTTLLWAAPLKTGVYDIVVNADLPDGNYTAGDIINNRTSSAGFTVLENVNPADLLCAGKTSFSTSESVFVTGEGFTPNDTVDIYVKTNATWMYGNPINIANGAATDDDGDGIVETVTTTGTGELPCTRIWANPLTSGSYDIVIDVNQDGVYNAGDAINNRLAGAGFTVP